MQAYDRVLGLLNGRKVLVVSCGPSAVKWTDLYNVDPDDRPIVICIKQAAELVEAPVDIHIFNQFNLRRYRPVGGGAGLKIFGVSESEKRPFWFVKRDIDYYVRGSVDWSDTVCAKGTDEDSMLELLRLDNAGVQNWGPGIMHEIVLPLLLASKATAVDIVGWDIADASGHNTHFDDGIRDHKSSQDEHDAPEAGLLGGHKASKQTPDLQFLKKKLKQFQCIARVVWLFRSLPLALRYAAGKKLNEAGMMPGEPEVVSGSVHIVKRLFYSAGKDFRIHTDSHWLQG